MNIKVDRDLFLSELYYLQGVAGAKQLIPIPSHLLIEAVHGKMIIRPSFASIGAVAAGSAGMFRLPEPDGRHDGFYRPP